MGENQKNYQKTKEAWYIDDNKEVEVGEEREQQKGEEEEGDEEDQEEEDDVMTQYTNHVQMKAVPL